MKAFLTNIVLAFVWLMLGEIALWRFFLGFFLGFIILSFFPNIQSNESYIKKMMAFFRFLKKFSWELLKANFLVAKMVLFKPKKDLHPFFLTYDVRGLNKTELLILNHCITLTPGTVTVLLSEDHTSLLVHVLSADSKEAIIAGIKNGLEMPILAFTRG
ncbi:Na(+)/H(+) antiporter subunit E1 [Chlamydiales bacterium STE3]|nr:Na(+)/H(+) antiporter subunit E1 [Chlamydiales bacterium STE3]